MAHCRLVEHRFDDLSLKGPAVGVGRLERIRRRAGLVVHWSRGIREVGERRRRGNFFRTAGRGGEDQREGEADRKRRPHYIYLTTGAVARTEQDVGWRFGGPKFPQYEPTGRIRARGS